MPSDTMTDDVAENGGDHVYRYGEGIELNLVEVPQAMLWLGFSRAMNHVMSNEVSSKVGTMVKKLVADGQMSDDEADPARKQWIADKTNELRLGYVDAVKSGMWGSGSRGPTGPRVDPIETEFNRAVANAVRVYLRGLVQSKSIAYDKESKTWFWDADGARQTRTFEEACDNYEAGLTAEERAVFQTQAEETVAFKTRQAEQAKRAAATPPTGLRL